MSALSIIFAAVLATNGVGTVGTTNRVVKANPLAHITSDSTYYDRKEGIAIFKGHVHVDDNDYQLHAKHAYVFMDTVSNVLSQIAATGGVAMTNGSKRAYGQKLTYRRNEGLVVLHGAPERPAVVIDAMPDGDRTVKGNKIRFWVNSEQVEVIDAALTAPNAGNEALPVSLPGAGK